MSKVFTFEEFILNEGKKKGLWDNVHARRKKGKRPLRPGEKGYPSKEAWDAVTNEAEESEKLNESAGIPDRYKKQGYTKIGVKKINKGSGNHKWSVLARKKIAGEWKYRIVKGGYKGMEDYTQHNDSQRRKNFWNRMGGKDSARAKDPFSPLYWHKRFGTW